MRRTSFITTFKHKIRTQRFYIHRLKHIQLTNIKLLRANTMLYNSLLLSALLSLTTAAPTDREPLTRESAREIVDYIDGLGGFDKMNTRALSTEAPSLRNHSDSGDYIDGLEGFDRVQKRAEPALLYLDFKFKNELPSCSGTANDPSMNPKDVPWKIDTGYRIPKSGKNDACDNSGFKSFHCW